MGDTFPEVGTLCETCEVKLFASSSFFAEAMIKSSLDFCNHEARHKATIKLQNLQLQNPNSPSTATQFYAAFREPFRI